MKFFHEWRQVQIKDAEKYLEHVKKKTLKLEKAYNLAYDLSEELSLEGYRSNYSFERMDIWPDKVEQVPFIIELVSDFFEENNVAIKKDWTFDKEKGWWHIETEHFIVDVNVMSVCKKVKIGTKVVDQEVYICGGE